MGAALLDVCAGADAALDPPPNPKKLLVEVDGGIAGAGAGLVSRAPGMVLAGGTGLWFQALLLAILDGVGALLKLPDGSEPYGAEWVLGAFPYGPDGCEAYG
jgi:hypothetical protein